MCFVPIGTVYTVCEDGARETDPVTEQRASVGDRYEFGWRERVRNVRLSDGTPIHIRPVAVDDRPAIADLYNRLSDTSRYLRFLSVAPRLPDVWLDKLANSSQAGRLGLVAQRSTDAAHEVVGLAQFEPLEDSETVEIAVLVDDAWQHKRLGRLLFAALLEGAAAQGKRYFVANVAYTNGRVIRAIQRSATILDRTVSGGVSRFVFMPHRLRLCSNHPADLQCAQ